MHELVVPSYWITGNAIYRKMPVCKRQTFAKILKVVFLFVHNVAIFDGYQRNKVENIQQFAFFVAVVENTKSHNKME